MLDTVKGINSVEFDSFFQERIVDPNGISVTDINAGLYNLFASFNEQADDFTPIERYFVDDIDTGYPDLIAQKSMLGNQRYWWWITLLNRLENPISDFKSDWVYSIVEQSQINSFINKTNETSESNNNRIGKVVELN